MVVDQQSLLEDKDRLEELRRSYDGEARLNESFIVLTVGASLIASLGLDCDATRGTSPPLDGALSRGAGSGFAFFSWMYSASSHPFWLPLNPARPQDCLVNADKQKRCVLVMSKLPRSHTADSK
ncbi:conserved hypothetical protein (DUF389) [Synechococcus sp. RS9902]|nr:conserved hypothetical protein (DUF389) [Synechococcus sp. RS9902]